jgi:hypothetical protein
MIRLYTVLSLFSKSTSHTVHKFQVPSVPCHPAYIGLQGYCANSSVLESLRNSIVALNSISLLCSLLFPFGQVLGPAQLSVGIRLSRTVVSYGVDLPAFMIRWNRAPIKNKVTIRIKEGSRPGYLK